MRVATGSAAPLERGREQHNNTIGMTRSMSRTPAWIVPGYNPRVSRRAYIDWTRGIAVLLMIEAHTVDAWTRGADRHSVMFRDAIVVGGFAAPLFLWLAGPGGAFSATGTLERTHRPPAAAQAGCRA